MSADERGGLGDRLSRMRRSFRGWRGQRPFWGGLLTLLGGIPIMYFPYASIPLGALTISMSTTAGAGSLIIGVLLVVLGLTLWFQLQSRVFAGVAAILLALVSLVVSNFGGFVVGYLLAMIGGALGVAWVPDKSGDAPDKSGHAKDAKSSQNAESAQDTVDAVDAEPAAAGAANSSGGTADDASGAGPTNDGTNGRHSAG
ncbi:DUF6114 domain-containing protein [Streptomyces sp. E11-3]|uniref:DUF6114 domain-containing protein n=1 Tax=Streptomyces sp. E11-3 TaxID=3110112 RepID=UPI0039801B88